MAYGIVKVDQITFTNGGIDQTISVSGIVQSISGNITATGTIQGATIIGTSTVSGATVTGDAGVFTTVTGGSAGFTTVTGTTVTGTTANFTTLSGTTVTGSVGNFGSGSAAAPAVSVGTTDNGIYSPGTDQVAISTNGTGRLFVDASGSTTLIGSMPLQIGNGTADASAKSARIAASHFTNAEEPVALIGALSTSTVGSVYIGGGFSNVNAATDIRFLTAANNTTTIGTERLRITSAGLVGIGSSTPNCQLTNTGTTSLGTNNWPTSTIGRSGGRALIGSGGVLLNWNETAGAGNAAEFYLGTATGAGATTMGYARLKGGTENGTNSASFFSIETSNTVGTPSTAIYVDSSQRVGIGTTTVGYKFEVKHSDEYTIRLGNSSETGHGSHDVKIVAGASYYQNPVLEGSSIKFNTYNGSALGERARIDSSGRLLVGTSSARTYTTGGAGGNYKLQLETAGTTSVFTTAGIYSNSDVAGIGAYLELGRSKGTSLGAVTAVAQNDILGEIRFAGTNGTAANSAASIAGYVDGAVSGGGVNDMPGRLVFSVTADGSASPSEAMRINNAGELLVGYTSDNGAYKLQVNSQIFATSAIIATSDGRYKENVAALDGCVDLVKALRPVSFDWKAQEPVTRVDEDGETVVVREAHNFPDGKQVGFIAQEVEEVLADKPWLGSVIKQNVRPAVTDADGNELAPEEEFLGIAEGNLVAVLTSALKDAIGRIETLEAEVAALKAS